MQSKPIYYTPAGDTTAQWFQVDTPVGSGKTARFIEVACKPKNVHRNVLYAAPTIELTRQTERDFRKKIGRTGDSGRDPKKVLRLTSDKRLSVEDPHVAEQALAIINGAAEGDGWTLLITTTTLLQIVAKAENPQVWDLTLDESYQGVQFVEVGLGRHPEEAWGTLLHLFDVAGPDDAYRITPKRGRRGDLEDGLRLRGGFHSAALRDLAAYALNKSVRCEVIYTGVAKELIDGTNGGKAYEHNQKATVACYFTPDYLARFNSVLFMEAQFTRSVTFHLLKEAYGVPIAIHPDYPLGDGAEDLRNTAVLQGPFVDVAYVLDHRDTASKANLFRDHESGTSGAPVGRRVLDKVIATVEGYCTAEFPGERYLLAINNRTYPGKHEDYLHRLAPTAIMVPVDPRGINEWQTVRAVAVLAPTNPPNDHIAWLEAKTKMRASEVRKAFRFRTNGQIFGRCEVRVRPGTTRRKLCIVVSREDALDLQQAWPGSRLLGKIGDMPPLDKVPDQEHPGFSAREKEVADRIAAFLRDPQLTANEVSSKALRGHCGSDVKNDTWKNASRLATQLLAGEWQRGNRRWERVTAELLGFVDEEATGGPGTI